MEGFSHMALNAPVPGRRARPAAALALAVGVLGLTALPAAAAAAPDHPITRGEVTAAFQARTTGGYVNLLAGRTVAAPVRGLHDGRISPFADGASYCSADWHYLGVTFLGAGGYRAASTYLRQTAVQFVLDGQLVPTPMHTAVKPFVDGVRGDFGISTGALVPPGSLATGWHTLETDFSDPAGTSSITIGFEVLDSPC